MKLNYEHKRKKEERTSDLQRAIKEKELKLIQNPQKQELQIEVKLLR